MKILLVQPPISDFYQTHHRMYPLGLLYLASSLKGAGFSCEILDAFSPRGRSSALPKQLQYLRKFYPLEDKGPFRLFGHFYYFGINDKEILQKIQEADLIGISSLFTTYETEVLRIAQMAKELGKIVVLGGTHASAVPEYLLQYPFIDYIVCGEGELRLPMLCEALCGKRPLETIDGLGYRYKKNIKVNPTKGVLQDLDTLPYPDRSMINKQKYLFRHKPYTMLLSSRGCPYQCRFCSGHLVMGRGLRFRSIENIISEMRLCRDKFQIAQFDFEDENFTYDNSRAIVLLEAIEAEFKGDENFSLLFENGLLPSSLNKEILFRFRKLGLYHLNLPLVTSSLRSLKKLKRPGSKKTFTQILKKSDSNFFITGYLILGLPSSTLEEMIQSISYLSEQQVLISASFFYAVPGMPLYQDCLKDGLLPDHSFLPLRSTAFPVETKEFHRLDLVTLFRLIRIINFIKSLIDGSSQRGEMLLSEFIKNEARKFPIFHCMSNSREIKTSGPLSSKELGLFHLLQWYESSFYFSLLQKQRLAEKKRIYRLIPLEYSENTWRKFNREMQGKRIRGTGNTQVEPTWSF